MKKLSAILVDDEVPCIETLSWDIKNYCPEIEIIATHTDPVEAIKSISNLSPDLLFLDIEMPAMTGFQLLEKLDRSPASVVFVTAFDQFAIRAFKVSAIDYLLKPVNKEDLQKAVEKAVTQIKKSKGDQRISTLLENVNSGSSNFPRIVFPTLEGLEFVDVSDIIRCESSSNYTIIHMAAGSKFVASKTLKLVEEMLDRHHFFRIHNSHLANMDKVKNYLRGEGGELVMIDGSRVPVSKRRKEEMMQFIAGLQKG